MNKKKYTGFIVMGVLVLLGIYLITTYNSLVNKDEKVKLQWNEVENAYQRRLSLIPNLVNVVKGQADFEQTTLQKIAEARSKAAGISLTGDVSADKYSQHNTAQNELAAATNNLIISIEKYPSLKGTAAFAGLQTQLEGTENRIKIARKDFNEAIAVYNNAARRFPTSVVAGLFSFKTREGFQADTGSDKSIVIKF
jgi:LemA protein